MVIKIRHATLNDASIVLKLNEGLVESQYKHFLKRSITPFLRKYNKPAKGLIKEKLAYIKNLLSEYYTIIAFDNLVPVGFLTVAFYVEPFYNVSSYAEITKLYVNEAYQGRGVASLLFKKAVSDFKDKSHYLMIGVNASNYKALRVYRNWGFIKHGYVLMLNLRND